MAFIFSFVLFVVCLVVIRGVYNDYLIKQAKIGYVPSIDQTSLSLFGFLLLSNVLFDVMNNQPISLVGNIFITILLYTIWIYMIRISNK